MYDLVKWPIWKAADLRRNFYVPSRMMHSLC